MLELSDGKFKITIINMFKAIERKGGNIHKLI